MLAAPLSSRSRVTWLDLIAVAVVTFAVFLPVFRSTLAPLDDMLMILENTKVTEFSWSHFKTFWTEPSFRIYMPLALSTWQLIAWLTHQGTPGHSDYVLPIYGFKIASVLTHALAAAGTVWTLSTLTRTRWPAIVGGLIFALHPMQVESVAWTTGLKDEFCGLFAILAIGCYACHAERDRPTPAKDAYWWLALLAAVLATLSKPTAMVLPAMLLAVDWALRRCSPAKRLVSVAVFLVPSIVIALVIFSVQGNTSVARLSLPLRPLVAADTYAFYMGKLLWPISFSIDYGRRPTVILESGAIYWTWIFPAAAFVGVLLARSRRWVLAAVLFIVPVLPVSGITAFDMQQYSTVADHYIYQSLAGAGLGAALLIARWPKAAGSIGVVVLMTLSVLTYRTASHWESPEGLYSQMLAENPHSWLARGLLGVVAYTRGDLFGLRRSFEGSLKENPKDSSAYDNMSKYYAALARYRESAEAALKANEFSPIPRAITGGWLALVAAKLDNVATSESEHSQAREFAEKGLRFWQRADPHDQHVALMLRGVLQAKKETRQRTTTTRPTTQIPSS